MIVAPELETVVVTGVGDVATAVGAMQQGASDFLLKPIDRGALMAAIHRALYRRSAAAIPTRLLDENIEFMGRLSLLERIVPLLGELDLAKAASGLLELCCTEACATQGALWLRSDKLAAHVAHRRAGPPLVFEAHLIGELWARDRGDAERKAARQHELERDIYARAAGVAAITHGLLHELRARFRYAGKAAVVPSAVAA